MAAATRGRPRTFDRAAALDAATRLFWERGYHATSLGDLTAAMGIRPGSLYKAFGDKQSLFREVVDSYSATPNAAFVRRALDETSTARAAFDRILHDAARIYADPAHPPGCLIITAATNVTGQDAEIEAFLRDIRNANLRTFRDRFDTAGKQGELAPDADPAALANFFAVVIQGMSQRARDGATVDDLRRVADLAMKTL
ncbi:TetR/AcrR family transcriptional regulator [Nocardia fusca]|uniref:TetR/AcrR family transcriptional regulator n=1 Tax=Nocardia fusca TaxID=941183 RepID=UPI003796465A